MDRNYELYNLWKEKAVEDKDLISELESIENDYSKIEDAFYKDLEFGTGGLRGVIGAGTNRVNIYTIAKASQGVANYVNKNFELKDRKIAISYDNRIKSDVFSKVAASVFAANNIKVFIYPVLMPTPCLSFAVRELKCAVGIMVTASHNPKMYNGYKVYNKDGCQITLDMADSIYKEIEKIDIFNDVKKFNFQKELDNKNIQYIDENVYTKFVEAVKNESVLKDEKINKDVAIIYTPLHGTGLKPVTRTLKESGYTNITVVKEQELPDGEFTTCPFPNPEIKESMELGMQYAKRNNADLVLATDPDCDRVGIAAKNPSGDYQLLNGNEVGILLFNFICERRIANKTMPKHPILIKTIVTSSLVEKIAKYYNVDVINVLTGYKFIGEQIGYLEEKHQEDNFIFSFEESYGYLSGSYVRDKDAVNGSFLICEMFAYYKTRNINLFDQLENIYKEFGYEHDSLYSFEFKGSAGFKKISNIMTNFKKNLQNFGKFNINKKIDYNNGLRGLPKSNVLEFNANSFKLIIRPSGTEPKIKIYLQLFENIENNNILNEIISEIQILIYNKEED